MAVVAAGARLAPAARAPTAWSPLRFLRVVPVVPTRKNFVVDAGDATTPLFLTVAVTEKLSPGNPLAGGLVSAVTVRSGAVSERSAMVTVPVAVVQLLPSEDSATTFAESMHAWTL